MVNSGVAGRVLSFQSNENLSSNPAMTGSCYEHKLLTYILARKHLGIEDGRCMPCKLSQALWRGMRTAGKYSFFCPPPHQQTGPLVVDLMIPVIVGYLCCSDIYWKFSLTRLHIWAAVRDLCHTSLPCSVCHIYIAILPYGHYGKSG